MAENYSSPMFSGDSGAKDVHAGGLVTWDFQVAAGAADAGTAPKDDNVVDADFKEVKDKE